MKDTIATVLATLAIGLRGLRSRALLSFGSVLLAAIAVGAAVVGPMYQSGSASSYLVTRLRAEPNFLTGEVFDFTPSSLGPDGYVAALGEARRLADQELNDTFAPSTLALWTRRTPTPVVDGETSLLSAHGQCEHVTLVGRCPDKPGEALILRADSVITGLEIGGKLRVPGVQMPLRVVGIYSSRAQDEDYWFDLSQLETAPLQPPPSTVPYQPAPFMVTPDTFDYIDRGVWYIKASRRLVVTSQTSRSDLHDAIGAETALRHPASQSKAVSLPYLIPEGYNQLPAIGKEVQDRSSTAQSTVAPAVISVHLVALLLLLRLLSAAMDLRRSELALASLRGYSRRQMWLLGLLEPGLVVAVATPLGLVGGYLGARSLARAWLVPGLPMPLGGASILALLAIVLVALVVATLVVREALSETLATQIAGVRRPGRSGRWSVVLRLVVVTAAVSVLVATLSAAKRSSPGATDLALPILLAGAAGLVTTLAAQVVTGWWAQWTSTRRSVFSYVAARTISRRREGTLVILPLTAALAVSVFAAGVFTAAADWRASDAATKVGAETSYPTRLSMDQAVALTHRIDPAGDWLMAIDAEFDGFNQILVVDAPRLPRVGLWPDSWTPDMDVSQVARSLAPALPSVVLRGSRVTLTVDNGVTGDYPTLWAELVMTDAHGAVSNLVLGPLRDGMSTVSGELAGCTPGCLVKQVTFGGPAVLPEAMHGSATITSIRTDRGTVPGFLDQSWRAAKPGLDNPVAVVGDPRISRAGLTVDFDTDSASSFAAITPADVPQVRPVVMGLAATPVVDGQDGNVLHVHTSAYRTLDVRPVTVAESMPVLGPIGMMIDFTMLTRDVAINDSSSNVSILARSDTPPPVVAALAGHGISSPVTLSTTRGVLDNDAFALALNLYLVVTAIVILLALAGLWASLAVQLPSRRRDAASLRVVGLRRRSIIAAVVTEFTVVLGAAAVAGIMAGAVAQYVVVRTVVLGYADSTHTPRLLPSLNIGSVLDLLVVVTAGLLVVAVTVAALIVGRARTATLREDV